MKSICLITSSHISSNPRLVKEADALHDAGYRVRVVAMVLRSDQRIYDKELMKIRNWKLETIDARRSYDLAGITWIKAVLRQRLFKFSPWLEKLPGGLEIAYGRYTTELTKLAMRRRDDLYIAHNLPALSVAVRAAEKYKSKVGFDAEDFHRGESEYKGSDGETIKRTIAVEEKYLKSCDYITETSDGIQRAEEDVLGKTYLGTRIFLCDERSGQRDNDQGLYRAPP